MNRREWRAIASAQRREAKNWPEALVRVSLHDWPARRPEQTEWPEEVWRSRHFLVQVYPVPPLGSIAVRRLSVNRVVSGTDGRFVAGISWDELQRCKREAGFGDRYAVEVYPRDRDVVDVANLRHLWVLSEPLGLGWFQQEGEHVRV